MSIFPVFRSLIVSYGGLRGETFMGRRLPRDNNERTFFSDGYYFDSLSTITNKKTRVNKSPVSASIVAVNIKRRRPLRCFEMSVQRRGQMGGTGKRTRSLGLDQICLSVCTGDSGVRIITSPRRATLIYRAFSLAHA